MALQIANTANLGMRGDDVARVHQALQALGLGAQEACGGCISSPRMSRSTSGCRSVTRSG